MDQENKCVLKIYHIYSQTVSSDKNASYSLSVCSFFETKSDLSVRFYTILRQDSAHVIVCFEKRSLPERITMSIVCQSCCLVRPISSFVRLQTQRDHKLGIIKKANNDPIEQKQRKIKNVAKTSEETESVTKLLLKLQTFVSLVLL